MQVREGKRGCKYVCFMIKVPKFLPGTISDTKTYAPRDLRDLRMSALTDAAKLIGDYLTEGKVEQQTAELALDLIYSELNRRLNRIKK